MSSVAHSRDSDNSQGVHPSVLAWRLANSTPREGALPPPRAKSAAPLSPRWVLRGVVRGNAEGLACEKTRLFSHKRLAHKYTVYIIESTADH